jgi:hypothetical protein
MGGNEMSIFRNKKDKNDKVTLSINSNERKIKKMISLMRLKVFYKTLASY